MQPGLMLPYLGPFPVVHLQERTMTILMNGHEETVSINRVKPAFVAAGGTVDPPAALAHHNYP